MQVVAIMDGQALIARIASLEAKIAQQEKTIARQAKTIAELRKALAQRDARIEELQAELKRRGKKYRPKANVIPRRKGKQDRRRKRFRKHPGVFRPEPTPDADTIHHDVRLDKCLHCGSAKITPTGQYTDHLVQEIPEPKLELHRYRRHEYQCACCQKTSADRGDLELPGSHIGPRARLFVGYARAYLGISLEKTCTLLEDLYGLSLSRAGALGHLRWASALFQPVVEQLLKLLRESPVVHADETGWRINGKNVWAWCFSNPKLAVFLIEQRRNAKVVRRSGSGPAWTGIRRTRTASGSIAGWTSISTNCSPSWNIRGCRATTIPASATSAAWRPRDPTEASIARGGAPRLSAESKAWCGRAKKTDVAFWITESN